MNVIQIYLNKGKKETYKKTNTIINVSLLKRVALKILALEGYYLVKLLKIKLLSKFSFKYNLKKKKEIEKYFIILREKMFTDIFIF